VPRLNASSLETKVTEVALKLAGAATGAADAPGAGLLEVVGAGLADVGVAVGVVDVCPLDGDFAEPQAAAKTIRARQATGRVSTRRRRMDMATSLLLGDVRADF
jgi:hypothetical protein